LRAVKATSICAALLCAAAAGTLAWAGHEMPVYPSFYPQEIDIKTLAPEQAPAALASGRLHAYIGRGVRLSDPRSDAIGSVKSLGSYVMVRVNPRAPLSRDEASMCAAVRSVVREVASGNVTLHPYPVTPFHGDYLYYADLAEAAKAKVTGAPKDPSVSGLRIKANGGVARSHPAWTASGTDWDIDVYEVDAANLVAAAIETTNGWFAPPWVKTGWFQAEQLLGDAVTDLVRKQRVDADLQRLESGDFKDLSERMNLERDLVTSLTSGCRAVVAGYTLKHEYFNADYSAGIENIGYDSITGLDSPTFLRTAKLKDFPWNGWLRLGIDAAPTSAWNPIGGMTDPFSRLMWFGIGDFALLPSPYDARWMLSRISDLPTTPLQ
jgi:hypothetical protein